MKLLYKKISLPEKTLFTVKRLQEPRFEETMHFHPAFEIIYIYKGSGTKIIGENITRFKAGDLAIVGPNVPHVWRNDKLKNPELDEAEVIEIHFSLDFLGTAFFTKPEMKPILQLLNKSAQGLNIFAGANEMIAQKMQQLIKTDDEFLQIITILEILECAATTNDVAKLCKATYSLQDIIIDSNRIDKINHYINKNFKEDITLDEVAEIACLSISAFCKYFKKHTNKTFSVVLNELKISYACRLLIEDDYPISQICYESGFKSITNFNRQFKTLTNVAPYEYRQCYRKEFFHASMPA